MRLYTSCDVSHLGVVCKLAHRLYLSGLPQQDVSSIPFQCINLHLFQLQIWISAGFRVLPAQWGHLTIETTYKHHHLENEVICKWGNVANEAIQNLAKKVTIHDLGRHFNEYISNSQHYIARQVEFSGRHTFYDNPTGIFRITVVNLDQFCQWLYNCIIALSVFMGFHPSSDYQRGMIMVYKTNLW